MESKLFGRWTVINGAIRWLFYTKLSTRKKKIIYLSYITCVKTHVCPCVEVEHYSHDPLRITSNLFPCLFSKFCWYLILGALFQFVFGFDQPKFINGPSNFIRFRSSFVCWIVCPVLSVVMYCRYLRKAETGDISSALAWFLVSPHASSVPSSELYLLYAHSCMCSVL